MERFAGLVVAGGCCLLAGLWLARLRPAGVSAVAGYGLAAVGALALAGGIADAVEWSGT